MDRPAATNGANCTRFARSASSCVFRFRERAAAVMGGLFAVQAHVSCYRSRKAVRDRSYRRLAKCASVLAPRPTAPHCAQQMAGASRVSATGHADSALRQRQRSPLPRHYLEPAHLVSRSPNHHHRRALGLWFGPLPPRRLAVRRSDLRQRRHGLHRSSWGCSQLRSASATCWEARRC